MKVTQVSIMQTEAAFAAGRAALTPELLAATGARYSRSNEGLETILGRIDPQNTDKSVDSIFRMIDYGHQSIADMAPVAMFIDGVSIWLAYYIWTACPTASGQESSTRYIKMNRDGLVGASELGIAEGDRGEWDRQMDWCFNAYHSALAVWDGLAARDPSLARIPAELVNDTSEKVQRQVARMRRNFAFDRARYFLPVAAKTNMMLIMSARGWVQLTQLLLSHYLLEAKCLGACIREELALSTPRLIKHSAAQASHSLGLAADFDRLGRETATHPLPLAGSSTADPRPFLDVFAPQEISDGDFADDLAFHNNRYAWVGERLRRTTVRFGWSAVALAEIRDLNRHRTGAKYCPLIPVGFYYADDQLCAGADQRNGLAALGEIAGEHVRLARARLKHRDPTYVYWTSLGAQYHFEHTTMADKFIYEAELRTGVGAHFRYAEHLHSVLALWYERFPSTVGLILEGSGEPE